MQGSLSDALGLQDVNYNRRFRSTQGRAYGFHQPASSDEGPLVYEPSTGLISTLQILPCIVQHKTEKVVTPKNRSATDQFAGIVY